MFIFQQPYTLSVFEPIIWNTVSTKFSFFLQQLWCILFLLWKESLKKNNDGQQFHHYIQKLIIM